MQKLIVVLIFIAILGGGAYFYINSSKKSANTSVQTQTQNTQKSGVTTKTGVISKAGGGYFIQEKGQEPLEIDSYSLDINSYLNKTVVVSGQYSGDTLFVTNIEVQK